MASKRALSRGEMEVARVLWDLGEATPRQVFEAYPNDRRVDFATVQTYLRRLEAKGYIRGRKDGKTKYYSPRIQPKTVIRETIDDLVNRLFGGEALPLMRYLVRERGVKPEEIDQLRKMLDQLEAQDHERAER